MDVRRRMAFGLAAVTTVFASRWSAAAATVDFRVSYQAAQGCPSADVFTHEILTRTSLAQLSSGTKSAFYFRVNLSSIDDAATKSPTGSKSRGELIIQEPDGSKSVRSVDGSSCGDVLSAFALIAALTMDPDASTEPIPIEKSHAIAPPKLPVKAVKVAPPEPGSGPALRTRLSDGPSRTERPFPVGVPAPPRKIDFINGADVGVDGGIAPRVMANGSLFVEALANDASTLGWAGRLSFLYAPSVIVPVPFPTGATGKASFEWSAVRAEVCPLRLASVDRLFSLYPCAGLEAGRTHASGVNEGPIDSARVENSLWLTALILARARVELAGFVSLEIQGGPVVTIQRQRFTFGNPDYELYRVPPLTAFASLGAGLHFR